MESNQSDLGVPTLRSWTVALNLGHLLTGQRCLVTVAGKRLGFGRGGCRVSNLDKRPSIRAQCKSQRRVVAHPGRSLQFDVPGREAYAVYRAAEDRADAAEADLAVTSQLVTL